jgi:putative transposase
MNLHRKRLRRIEHPGHARYLTCSCYHRLALFDNDAIKQVFVDQLEVVTSRLPVDLFAWVLMPEHFHLLLLPEVPRVTVPDILVALKQPIARTVLARWRELDAPVLNRITDVSGAQHFWQPGGGYDRNIVGGPEVEEKVSYTHGNPVRRGLVKRAVDWHWSSAPWYYGVEYHGPVIQPVR